MQRSKSYFPRTVRGFLGCNPPTANPPWQRNFYAAGWDFFRLRTTQAFSGGAGRRGVWEHLRIVTCRGKRSDAFFSTSAAQPVFNDNRRQDCWRHWSSLKFCSGKWLPCSIWKSEWTGRSLKELGKPFLLRQRQTLLWYYHCAKHPSCSQASLGDSQLCWDISVLMWMCHCLTLPPQETVTWVKMRLVWQVWLKLGTNIHQWFKMFEEDLLVSRSQKTILYKAPLPKKKFTLGL